jgi:hypothetical protein
MPDKQLLNAASQAHARGLDLERQLLARYPRAWEQMDRLRADPPAGWPDWCLLPMAAAEAVTSAQPGGSAAGRHPPIAHLSALYAWRFARSVYLIEPGLRDRLMGRVPDHVVGPGAFAGLPEWCVFIADAHPEFPGSGVWAHLESDANTGRPELRLLFDPAGTGDVGALVPVPVYLDRPDITEAAADFRATAAATIQEGQLVTGADVRDAGLDAATATIADWLDTWISVLLYLSRPRADIVRAGRAGARPARPLSPMREQQVWLVGYSA